MLLPGNINNLIFLQSNVDLVGHSVQLGLWKDNILKRQETWFH